MLSDPVECYRAIGNLLSCAAKEPWDRIVLDAALDGARVDVVVGCWREGETVAFSYLTGIPRLARSIHNLAHLVSTEEKGLFRRCTFTLYKNGEYNVDFTY
jgi:hypothetical protein